MDGDPTPALIGRRRTRPTSPGCRNPQQPKPGRTPLILAQAAVQTNRATSDPMSRKRHKPEEIVSKLRQVDVLIAQGTPVADAVRAIGVTEVASGRAAGW